MAKAPAFQFYADDWLGSTKIALMTPAEEGAYIRLLAHAWNSGNCSIPDNDKALSILSRLGDTWTQSRDVLRSCFRRTDDGLLVNDRLLKERRKQLKHQRAMSNAGIEGNKRRWGSDRQAIAKGIASDRSSSSSSSSSSEDKESPAARAVCVGLVDLWNVGKAEKARISVTPKRVAKVQARLKDGLTEQDMRLAISNCLKSEWHQGGNERGWRAPGPEWVLHTIERAEEWKNKAQVTAFAEKRDAFPKF